MNNLRMIGFIHDYAPINSTIRNIPSEILLTKADGMPKECAINLDHVQTVTKGKIESLITTLSSQKMAELFEALLICIGI